MLLADRNILVDQEVIAEEMMMPSQAEDIAERLRSLSPLAWTGGSLSEGTPISWKLVDHISRDRGSWAALLEPLGPTRQGHWVVVDGIDSEGLVLIRDPVGSAYGLPLRDFARLWGYSVLVIQAESP